MTEEAIEQFADDILAAHEIRSLPVDPFSIARQEKIALFPGDYDGCFDGRIEYRGGGANGRFVLFYARPQAGLRPEGRVRFSVAHELGHFYLPRHRDFLVSGVWHGSRAGFVSEKPLEREADRFATALLMPRKHFFDAVRARGSVCTLNDLSQLADRTFQTSLTSTAVRYVQLDAEPCCVVVACAESVMFSFASEEMRGLGLGWLTKGSPVPANSPTARLLRPGGSNNTDGAVDSDVWFDARRSRPLWEETVALGQTGMVLTLLTCDGGAEDEDEPEED